MGCGWVHSSTRPPAHSAGCNAGWMALSRVESHVGMNGLDSFIKALPPRAPLPVPHVHHARDMPRCRMIIKIAVPHAAATTDVRQQYETLEVMPEEAIQVRIMQQLPLG